MCAESGWLGACMWRSFGMRQARAGAKRGEDSERRRVHKCSKGYLRGAEPAHASRDCYGSVSRFLPSPGPLSPALCAQMEGFALMLALMLSLCLQMKDCCGLQPALQPACPEVLVQHILGMQVSVMDL